MKRSEAVQKLIDAVYLASESDLTMTEEEASNLLNYIETRIGMLPPTLTGTAKVEVDEETGEMFIKLWGWESEEPTEEELQDQGKRSGAVKPSRNNCSLCCIRNGEVMKVTLEFELPQETEEYELAMNGAKTRFALDDVWEKVFRPRHKHGFGNKRLNELLEDDKVNEAMDILEQLYREALEENEVT